MIIFNFSINILMNLILKGMKHSKLAFFYKITLFPKKQ